MKYLIDNDFLIPKPEPAGERMESTLDRNESGKRPLQSFLYDGKIRGVDREGNIYEQNIDVALAKTFVERLKTVRVRGATSQGDSR